MSTSIILADRNFTTNDIDNGIETLFFNPPRLLEARGK